MFPESCMGTGGSWGAGDSPAPAREVVKPLLAAELGVWDTVAVSHSKSQQAGAGAVTCSGGMHLISDSVPIQKAPPGPCLLLLLSLAAVSVQGLSETARRVLVAARWDQLPWLEPWL